MDIFEGLYSSISNFFIFALIVVVISKSKLFSLLLWICLLILKILSEKLLIIHDFFVGYHHRIAGKIRQNAHVKGGILFESQRQTNWFMASAEGYPEGFLELGRNFVRKKFKLKYITIVSYSKVWKSSAHVIKYCSDLKNYQINPSRETIPLRILRTLTWSCRGRCGSGMRTGDPAPHTRSRPHTYLTNSCCYRGEMAVLCCENVFMIKVGMKR